MITPRYFSADAGGQRQLPLTRTLGLSSRIYVHFAGLHVPERHPMTATQRGEHAVPMQGNGGGDFLHLLTPGRITSLLDPN